MTKMIKPNSAKAKKAKSKKLVDDVLGIRLDPEESNADINLAFKSRENSPSRAWSKVNPDSIGEGFEAVDLSVFDSPRPGSGRLDLPVFHNRFIQGSSKFITYTVKVVFTPKKASKKRNLAINADLVLSKPEKKKFALALDSNIKKWRKLFIQDILPISLSIQTASEEVKDQTSQLIDESVSVPVDYIKLKTIQAIYLRVNREVSERFQLTPKETKALSADLFPPKVKK